MGDVAEFADRLESTLERGERTRGRKSVRQLDSPRVARRIIQVYEKCCRTVDWLEIT